MGGEYRSNKLYIGCNTTEQLGFTTIDQCSSTLHGVFTKDSNGEAVNKGVFQQIVAQNVLELVSWDNLPDTLLEWNDILENSGELHIQTIDCVSILRDIVSQPKYYEEIAVAEAFFRGGSKYYDTRTLGFTESTIKTQLIAAGFTVAHIGRSAGHAFEIEARKSLDWSAIAGDKADPADFIRACYSSILFRAPSDEALALESGWLKSGEMTRRAVIKKLLSSEERRLTIARLHGF